VNDADANKTYGGTQAELYLAGFAFERAMGRVLGLLKDGAWRRVGDGFDDINDFVRSLRLDQFRAVAQQRRDFVERVKELQPQVSNRAIAGALGVASRTIDRDAATFDAPGARKSVGNASRTATFGAPDGRRDASRITQRDTREERREEKLASKFVAAGDLAHAVASMASALKTHPETDNPALNGLVMIGMMYVTDGDTAAVQRWIDRFQ
jgi:hypothetical protein